MPCSISYTDKSFIYTFLAFGLLSSLASIFIILYCIYMRGLQVFSFKLIFYISLSQFFSTLEFLFPVNIQATSTVTCSFFGFMINSSQLICILWMACIAFSINQAFMGSVVFYEKYEKYWTVAALFLIPGVNCIPIITGSYEAIGSYCSYDTSVVGTLERIFIFFVPAWLMLIYSIGCYLRIFVMMKKRDVGLTFKRIIQRLMYYPILMGIYVVLLTVERFWLYYMDECGLRYLDLVVGGFGALIGFFNFIVFICTPGTLAALNRTQMKMSFEDLSDIESSLRIIIEDSSRASKVP